MIIRHHIRLAKRTNFTTNMDQTHPARLSNRYSKGPARLLGLRWVSSEKPTSIQQEPPRAGHGQSSSPRSTPASSIGASLACRPSPCAAQWALPTEVKFLQGKSSPDLLRTRVALVMASRRLGLRVTCLIVRQGFFSLAAAPVRQAFLFPQNLGQALHSGGVDVRHPASPA